MKNSTNDKIDYLMLQKELAIRNARKDFWTFCKLLYPEFFKEDRLYLKDLCKTLQDFYEDVIDKKILVINMPPRHGKTFTARLFVLWMFGQNTKTKIITGSYNQILSSLFAQQTRDGIMVENENIKNEVYVDIFPKVQIKQGDAAKGFWSLDGSEEKNYLATSPGGTSTGIGANYVIVDDIIKMAEEAYNQDALDAHWEWYNNTLVQRMERPRKQILIMTRWSSKDLAGKMLEKKANQVHQISYKAVQDDKSMLCDDIMTYEEYLEVTQEMNPDIASANYQQEPIDVKGKLYSSFKTYDDVPRNENGKELFKSIKAYCDTADEGSDYLCNIIYGRTMDNEAYILDVYYSQEPMEITENELAKRLIKYKVNSIDIESNNGGRGFARAVESKLKEKQYNKTKIQWFHQSKNKKARILSNSTWVMDHIYFPNNWKDKWPEYYKSMFEYQREGKNKHDDAQDATTGVAEKINNKDLFSFT